MSDTLQIAMQMRDTDVGKPGRTQPGSLTSQIAALENQLDCCAKIQQVPLTDVNNLAAIKKALSDSAHTSMRNAKRRNGMENVEFSIQTASTITSAGHIYAMAIITRVSP